jgi:RNA polymerase sigma factor (sigma-70 family)
MKYVRLLKGEISHQGVCMRNTDTMEFLALFHSAPQKEQTRDWHIRTYNFISQVCQPLEEEDIYNELCVRFIELLDSYQVYEGTSFTRYLTKYLRWSIKRWVIEMARGLQVRGPYEAANMSTEEACEDQPDMIDLPEMNLQWIVDPQSKLFGVLSPYERFLLYLNFKEGLGVRQIGDRLGRMHHTINRHIRGAINKLQQEYQKEKGV